MPCALCVRRWVAFSLRAMVRPITLAFDIFLQDYDLSGRPGAGGLHLVMDDPAVAT